MATGEQQSRHPGEHQNDSGSEIHENTSHVSPTQKIPRIIAALLIPVFLYLTWIAGSWGLADIYARPAILKLNNWKQGEIEIKQEEWEGLIADLSRALALDENNPEIHQWLGLAIEGPYIRGRVDWEQASAARRDAAEHYRESIRLQPTWPYAWADLATVKFRLREFDDELINAMHKSMELGPWEPGIQKVVADMGMLMWYRLSDTDKEFILDVARKSLLHADLNHVGRMKKLIEERNFVERVCREPDSNEKLSEYCLEKVKSKK